LSFVEAVPVIFGCIIGLLVSALITRILAMLVVETANNKTPTRVSIKFFIDVLLMV
jgi:hypothetical protein